MVSDRTTTTAAMMIHHSRQHQLVHDNKAVLGDDGDDYAHDDVVNTSIDTASTGVTTACSSSSTLSTRRESSVSSLPPKSDRSVVKFGAVTVFEFPIAIGDSPSVSSGGVPIQIAPFARHVSSSEFPDVDSYEEDEHSCSSSWRRRRSGRELVLDEETRYEMYVHTRDRFSFNLHLLTLFPIVIHLYQLTGWSLPATTNALSKKPNVVPTPYSKDSKKCVAITFASVLLLQRPPLAPTSPRRQATN